MMRYFITLLICSLTAIASDARTMTLRECIAEGVNRNLSLSNARIGMDKSRLGVTQNRSRLLPVINGAIQASDYLVRPVSVTSGTLLDKDFPDEPTWQKIRSMQYQATAGMQLGVPLFDKTILASIDVARTVEQISALSYDKAVEDLTVQIAKVYYLAQSSLAQMELTEENIERMDSLCEITQALYDQVVVLEVDLNRVRINRQYLQSQQNQFQTLHAQQLNLLRYLLDYSLDADLEVEKAEDGVDAETFGGVNEALPELKIAEQQIALVQKRISTVNAGYLPSVSFLVYAGGLGYQEKFDHWFHTHDATRNWFGNVFVGLRVNIPIFDANTKKHQKRQLRYDAEIASNNRDQTRKRLMESYANATEQLRHNLQVYATQSHSASQAEDVYNITAEQYREGVSSMTALLQDEMQLRTAESACIQAQTQCRLARLDLLKLTGNLSKLSE